MSWLLSFLLTVYNRQTLPTVVLMARAISSVTSDEPLDWLSEEAVVCFSLLRWCGRLSRVSERCLTREHFIAFIKSAANDQDWQAVKDARVLALNRYITRGINLSWHCRKQWQTSNGNLCLVTSSVSAIRCRVGGKLGGRTQHGVVVVVGVVQEGVWKGCVRSLHPSCHSQAKPSTQEVERLLGTSCPFRWSRAPIQTHSHSVFFSLTHRGCTKRTRMPQKPKEGADSGTCEETK